MASCQADVAVDALSERDWDSAAAEFADVAYDQTACFSDGRWGAGRSSHLMLRREGACIAGARVVIFRPPLFRRGLAYVRSGPFWRRPERPADTAVYREALAALRAEYAVRRGHYLVIAPRPHPDFHDRECAMLAEMGFLVRRPSVDPNRYFVDIGLGRAAQLASLDQKWRYNLKKSMSHGFAIAMGESPDDMARFTALHAAMVARKHLHDGDPVHLLPDLARALPRSLAPRVVLARHEDQPVAGAVVVLLGDTALYLFGASDERALPLKAGYALQWWIVEWLAGQGVRWYDLGGEAMTDGLRQFKHGLVGKRGRIIAMPGDYSLASTSEGRLAAQLVFWARDLRRNVRSLLPL